MKQILLVAASILLAIADILIIQGRPFIVNTLILALLLALINGIILGAAVYFGRHGYWIDKNSIPSDKKLN